LISDIGAPLWLPLLKAMGPDSVLPGSIA